MSQIETWMMWRGGMWRYDPGAIQYFLRDDGCLAHGIVRPGPEGDEMVTALAVMQTQPDGTLLFKAGGTVRTMPAGSDPAEVRVVWEGLIAGAGGNDAHTT